MKTRCIITGVEGGGNYVKVSETVFLLLKPHSGGWIVSQGLKVRKATIVTTLGERGGKADKGVKAPLPGTGRIKKNASKDRVQKEKRIPTSC